MIEGIDTLLFDLDGTLTNPKEGIVNSIIYALEKLGIKEKYIDELDTFIGPPLRESFVNRYNFNDEEADKAMVYYREYFAVNGIYENKLYPGVPEMLESLSLNKYRLFVATSKPTVYAIEILKYFKLDSFFIATVGSNLDNTRTDKAEVIAFALADNILTASHSIMIGDRKHDIIGAKMNALKSIGVTYGFGSRQELTYCNPEYIVNNCKEIETLFVK